QGTVVLPQLTPNLCALQDWHEAPAGHDACRPFEPLTAPKAVDLLQVARNPPVRDSLEVPSEVIRAAPFDFFEQGRGKVVVRLGEQLVGARGQLVDVAGPPPPRLQPAETNQAFGPQGIQVALHRRTAEV